MEELEDLLKLLLQLAAIGGCLWLFLKAESVSFMSAAGVDVLDPRKWRFKRFFTETPKTTKIKPESR